MNRDQERILDRCIPEPNSGCWLWVGEIHPKGHGRVYIGARNGSPKVAWAHRAAYAAFKSDPGSLHVLHKCDTPSCVNPEHLYLGHRSLKDSERLIRTTVQRILDRCVPEPNSGCWLWTGDFFSNGYGRIYMPGSPNGGCRERAHRVSYMVFRGPVGDLQVLHKCDTPACVNPDHLFLGTHLDNIDDRARKGRTARIFGPPNCPRGHMFSGENVRVYVSNGRNHRRCMTCERERARARYWRDPEHTRKMRRDRGAKAKPVAVMESTVSK